MMQVSSQETKTNTILDPKDHQTKQRFSVAIIGDSGVGKTSLINRYIFQKFNSDYMSTIEDFYSIQIKLPQTKMDPEQTYILDLIDTAGLEEFSQVREKSLRDQSAFLFIYKAESKDSLDIIDSYLNKIIQLNSDQKPHQRKPILIVANRQSQQKLSTGSMSQNENPLKDNQNNQTTCSMISSNCNRTSGQTINFYYPELDSLNQKYGKFFEFQTEVCSAKTGEGIARVFQNITQMIVGAKRGEEIQNFKQNRKRRLIKSKNVSKYDPKNGGELRHCCSFTRYQNCGIF